MVVYRFDHPHLAASGSLTAKLGGKGAGLAAMTRTLEMPIPPGLTIPTTYQSVFAASGVTDALMQDVQATLRALGLPLGRAYGDAARPLLVSVRSGAAISMPGMMDTILNVGLTEETTEGLAAMTGARHFALESYRRFLAQFAEIALGLPTEPSAKGDETTLAAEISTLRSAISNAAGASLLDDPDAILRRAITAVFESWDSPRAKHYRAQMGLSETEGTAVNIQAMVFGNLDAASGTGVVFSRDPSTGAPGATGDYLPCAQGEDVVAGLAATRPYDELQTLHPAIFVQLQSVLERLEHHYTDMVDVEFTIESGNLWVLQARKGKRTPAAAARIAIDLAEDPAFPVTRAQALARLPDGYLDASASVATANASGAIAKGLGASPGIATGRVVFSSEDAVDAAETNDVILVRKATSPADIHGMSAAKGILTTLGGQMSHAAVVARDWSLPAIVGASDIVLEDGAFTVGDHRVAAGDIISIDGKTGEVFAGEAATTREIDPSRETLLGWAQASGMATALPADPPNTTTPTPQPQIQSETHMPRLQGKVAIITGATGGIGAAAAETFLREGASVVLVARNLDKLSALEGTLAQPERVAISQGDVASEDDTKRYIQVAKERFGKVDIVFANAGSEGAIKPLVELSVDEFDAIQTTNIRGSWLSIKHAAPEMIASGGGSIILTSSVAGMVGVPGLSAYSASKHALVGLAQVAALEMAPMKVRTNVIAPAPIDNAMMRSIEKQAAPDAPEAAADGFRALIPMGRYGTNDEVANMALFLASDEASFCNGNVYAVDGGFLAA